MSARAFPCRTCGSAECTTVHISDFPSGAPSFQQVYLPTPPMRPAPRMGRSRSVSPGAYFLMLAVTNLGWPIGILLYHATVVCR